MKYIPADKLIAEIERRLKIVEPHKDIFESAAACRQELIWMKDFITSLQQEQSEENKLPNKRTRVNYAICKLQSFKPLREAIVLDDYVYDEGKCYRENLLNYIHAIPERRLMEIRSYLREKGWWPYNDDADWMEQEQLGVDVEKEIEEHAINMPHGEFTHESECEEHEEWAMKEFRYFYELGQNARKEE